MFFDRDYKVLLTEIQRPGQGVSMLDWVSIIIYFIDGDKGDLTSRNISERHTREKAMFVVVTFP